MTGKRPTVNDVDPEAMAVNATPDQVRTHSDADETENAQRNDGAVAPVADDTTDSETDETPDDAERN